MNYTFILLDEGKRGDEKEADGIFSIKIPIPRDGNGINPQKMYDLVVRVKNRKGEIINSLPLGSIYWK